MTQLICPRDKVLTVVTMALGSGFWIAAVVALVIFFHAAVLIGSLVTLLVAFLAAFFAYAFARSATITHLMGNGVQLSDAQFPDLYGQFSDCCKKLSPDKRPDIFVLNGNGVLNAFATWFLGSKYVVILSSVVDAMEGNASGIRFYIGHELAHTIRHDNVALSVLRWPALRLPLLGAAFSRSRESTCDLHGLACSDSSEDAARSLAALATGAGRWKSLSLPAVRLQLALASGFWMSFHELIASYPWTTKRIIRVLDENAQIPRRNPFAYVFALFVPYAGRMPAGLGVLLYVYFIAVGAAIAIPAYQTYTTKAVLTKVINDSQGAREKLSAYYAARQQVPPNLGAAGIDPAGPNGLAFSLSVKGMVLSVKSTRGTLIFVPSKDGNGAVIWNCRPGPDLPPARVPLSCR